jgi:elongation factor P
MKAKDIRRGNVIIYRDAPHRVLDFHHHTPGNLRALVQTKLRNLINGMQTEARFSSIEDLQLADIYAFQASYLYRDSSGYHFMNSETYEETIISEAVMGENAYYLHDGMVVEVVLYNGNAIGITPPKTVVLTVADTTPELRGATASNSPKPATTDTGLVISVPQFVKVGDRVSVDTETAQYLSRAD